MNYTEKDAKIIEKINKIKGGKTHKTSLSSVVAEELLYGTLRFVITKNFNGYQRGDKIKFSIENANNATTRLLEGCTFKIDYVWSGYGVEQGFAGLALTLAETEEEAVWRSWEIGMLTTEDREQAEEAARKKQEEAARKKQEEADEETYVQNTAEERYRKCRAYYESRADLRKIADDNGWHGATGLVFVEKEGEQAHVFKSLIDAATFCSLKYSEFGGMSTTEEPRQIGDYKVTRKAVPWGEPLWANCKYKFMREARQAYRSMKERENGVKKVYIN